MRKGENIYKRKDGRWEGRFTKERNDQGRIVYGYVYGKRYAEVKEKLAVKRAQRHPVMDKRKTYDGTVAEWLSYWLEHMCKPTIKVSTYVSYRGIFDRHIYPHIGQKKLLQLTHKEMESFMSHLKEKQLSNRSLQQIFGLLNRAIQQAIKEEKLHQDPCKHIVLAPVRKSSTKALSISNQQKLECAALKDANGVAVIIALYTGMRIGEISGLRWEDIDWARNRLHVRRTVARIPSITQVGKTEIVIDVPKTPASLREIPLSTNLKRYLQQEKQLTTSKYVVSCNAHLTEPRIITSRFKKILSEAGLSSIRFHSLRHTFATRCLEQRADIATLSKIMGHSSVKMTLDTYADSLWESKELLLNKLDQQLQL